MLKFPHIVEKNLTISTATLVFTQNYTCSLGINGTCFATGHDDGLNNPNSQCLPDNNMDDNRAADYCSGFYSAHKELGVQNKPTSNSGQGQATTTGGPNYSVICQTLQPVLIQRCDTLVYSDGSLTTDGIHAMHCIRNGILLGTGASLLGLPLPLVLKGLSLLSAPTGCEGIVNTSAFILLNIGSISSLLSSLP